MPITSISALFSVILLKLETLKHARLFDGFRSGQVYCLPKQKKNGEHKKPYTCKVCGEAFAKMKDCREHENGKCLSKAVAEVFKVEYPFAPCFRHCFQRCRFPNGHPGHCLEDRSAWRKVEQMKTMQMQ